jgi:nucleoside-diphosphate-sugar epimerase
MNVIVLGGAGFIGSAISRRLSNIPDVNIVVASRSGTTDDKVESIRLDATDAGALGKALSDKDVVVNCITGTADIIEGGADALAQCTANAQQPITVIHMSSMAVYGDELGRVDESSALPSSGNWYASAKRYAEQQLRAAADKGVAVFMMRIGCVFGPASPLWVDRIGVLIRQGRLGDIGELGDGWSNLVHVDDIAEAVVQMLKKDEGGTRIYNFVAPDSPRWNDYFRDFALAIDCVPLRYKTHRSMTIESYLRAPLCKGVGLLLRPLGLTPPGLPIVPPSLLRLWEQQISLDCTAIERDLDMLWTSYDNALSDSTSYFKQRYGD